MMGFISREMFEFIITSSLTCNVSSCFMHDVQHEPCTATTYVFMDADCGIVAIVLMFFDSSGSGEYKLIYGNKAVAEAIKNEKESNDRINKVGLED